MKNSTGILSIKVITIALLLYVIFMYPVHAAPIVTLDLLDGDIAIGDTFDVAVWADGDGIGTSTFPYYYSLTFSFDVSTTDFKYNEYTLAPGFDDDSTGGNNVKGSKNNIYADDVLLATLSFTALVAGSGNIGINGMDPDGLTYIITPPPPTNLEGEDVFIIIIEDFYFDESIDIMVSNAAPAPVPEPATMILLGTGLVGLAGFRGRFKK